MKRYVLLCGSLGMAALLAAQGAQALQTVFPASDSNGTLFPATPAISNSWSVSRGGGQTLVFYARYNSDNPTESGLGLQVAFDATKLKSVVVDQILTKCIVSYPPDTTTTPGSLIMGWVDTSVRTPPAVGWPTLADGAPPLPGSAGCITLPGSPPGYVQTTAGVPLATNLFRFTATTDAAFTSGSTSVTFGTTGGAAFTPTTLVVNGIVPPACNLDADNSGGNPTAGVDGVLIKRALNSFIPAANIPIGITFPVSATRKIGSDIRTYVQGLGNVLDVDGNGASAPVAGVDGVLIQRALNTFIASSAITNGVTTPATGAQVRTYLNTNCGTSLTP